MISLSVRVSAFAAIVLLVSMAAAPAFASPRHPVCAAKEHACGQARIVPCCCPDQGDAQSDESTPAAAKSQVAPPSFDALVELPCSPAVDRIEHARVMTTPPRSSPPDLITLFGTLLI